MEIETSPLNFYSLERPKKSGGVYHYWEARRFVKSGHERKLITACGRTKKDAETALNKKIRETYHTDIKTVKVPETRLDDALKAFNLLKLGEKWRDSTYCREETIREKQIAPILGDIPPLEVSHEDILLFLSKLREQGYKESAVHKAFALLNEYFRYTYQDTPALNPCRDIKVDYAPKLDEDKILTTEEIKAVFKACDALGGNADIVKFQLLIYCRPGEVRVLRFSDWNRKEKRLKIIRTMTQNRDGKFVISDDNKMKTINSPRSILLSDMAQNVLIKRYDEAEKRLKKRPGNALIWSDKNDPETPLSYQRQRRLLVKVLQTAGIEKHITPHALRHSGITFYARDRNAMPTVSAQAGHRSEAFTAEYYAHLLDENRVSSQRSANLLNSIFEDGNGVEN